jgi:methylmalonyl-CoA/ethylmalonyl-CoA epimerase
VSDESPRVLALDHTALALRSIAEGLPLYRDLLGGREIDRGENLAGGLRFVTLRYPNGNALEIVEPSGPDGLLERFLAVRGRGLHHLTFVVDDAPAMAERLRAAGFRVVDEHYDDPRWRVAYVSPRSAGGTILQIAEGSWSVPPGQMIPDDVRQRARALLDAASDPERAILERFADALGLLHAPEPREIHPHPEP